MAVIDYPHPEKRPGEVWFTNHLNGTFPNWKSARTGVVAYDIYGSPISSGHIPVFVEREELEAAGIAIRKADWEIRPSMTGDTIVESEEQNSTVVPLL